MGFRNLPPLDDSDRRGTQSRSHAGDAPCPRCVSCNWRSRPRCSTSATRRSPSTFARMASMRAERLDIYRNNLREGFVKALALGFPVIERLVGAEYFHQLAIELLRAHPSRSGNLHHGGQAVRALAGETIREHGVRVLRRRGCARVGACGSTDCSGSRGPSQPMRFGDIDPADYERSDVRSRIQRGGFVQSELPGGAHLARQSAREVEATRSSTSRAKPITCS